MRSDRSSRRFPGPILRTLRHRILRQLAVPVHHLLPKGHDNRDHLDFIVTLLHVLQHAAIGILTWPRGGGLYHDGLTPDEWVAQLPNHVGMTSRVYQEFGIANVQPCEPTEH